MNSSADIWLAFAGTFSMLFLVLAVLILVFYLVRKFLTARGGNTGKNLIRVLSVHHFSPKEKIVLVDVMGESILIGVTPANISKISSLETKIDLSERDHKAPAGFSDFLSQKLKNSFQPRENMETKVSLKKEEA
jgi:flagellar protein FliO/FliZ